MATRLLYQNEPLGSAEEATQNAREYMASPRWVWLDIVDHQEAEVATLCDELGLDPMVLEDIYDIELLATARTEVQPMQLLAKNTRP